MIGLLYEDDAIYLSELCRVELLCLLKIHLKNTLHWQNSRLHHASYSIVTFNLWKNSDRMQEIVIIFS